VQDLQTHSNKFIFASDLHSAGLLSGGRRHVHVIIFASEMTYIVSGGALNSTHSLMTHYINNNNKLIYIAP